MNRALPEMIHCFAAPGNCADITVFERQTARLKWHQDQLHHHHNNLHSYFPQSFSAPIRPAYVPDSFIGSRETELGEVVLGSVKPDPGLENGWPELGKFETPTMDFGSGLELDPSISRILGSPTAMMEAKNRESVLSENLNSAVERESFKKRKSNTKIVNEEDTKEKRIKVCAEEGDSKVTDQIQTKNNSTATTAKRETSSDTSKENSKASEVQKPDYIHVRARRGQATDSHSLAERARREKISERMKYLQDLVPGCNKIAGKAGMLDEIINYVQSLQRQVEFLSMKLSAVNPRLELNVNVVDDIFPKEAHPTSNFPPVGIQSELNSPAYLHFDQSNPMASNCGFDPSITGLRRTISAPVSLPENYLHSACFPVSSSTPSTLCSLLSLNTLSLLQNQPSPAWDGDLQSLYNVGFDQGRTEDFPSHPYAGSIEISNLKMEM